MVVIGIFHSERAEERAVRLVAAYSEEIYEEKIGEHETLVSMRAESLTDAEYISGLLEDAGATQIEIDAEAA
jgi:hypothetical protein